MEAKPKAVEVSVTDVLKECLALFDKDHAIDRFDWAKSALRAQDIRELNELPGKIRAALRKAEANG